MTLQRSLGLGEELAWQAGTTAWRQEGDEHLGGRKLGLASGRRRVESPGEVGTAKYIG